MLLNSYENKVSNTDKSILNEFEESKIEYQSSNGILKNKYKNLL